MVFKKRTRKTYRKKSTKKMTAKSSTMKVIKAVVKKQISRNIETKTTMCFLQDQAIYSSSNTSFFINPIPMTPYASGFNPIVQGTGQGDRIGNQITLTKLRFKGNIYPAAYNAISNGTPQPSYVIFWFYKYRATPTITQVPDNEFLQYGNTSRGLSNSLTDRWAPINKDKVILLGRKVYKVGFASFNQSTGSLGNLGNVANNDFKLVADFSIDLLKWAPKKVTYNDNSSTPTSDVICCMPQAVASVGNYNSSSIPVFMDYIIECEYKDA